VPQYKPCYGVIGTILLLSFVLTAIRARTRNLLPCVVIHFIFNAVQGVLIVLGPYLEHFFPDTPPAPEPGLLVGLILRICGVAW
ncbi:MAG: type II CAAX prenyl endopeptidase Rce1 family protein, partial [Pyrinomonadaceae bacterium]